MGCVLYALRDFDSLMDMESPTCECNSNQTYYIGTGHVPPKIVFILQQSLKVQKSLIIIWSRLFSKRNYLMNISLLLKKTTL